MKKLLAIDGNSIINRAFYGIRPLTNKDGLYTHAVYGMLNIITSQMQYVQPDMTVAAFDLKGRVELEPGGSCVLPVRGVLPGVGGITADITVNYSLNGSVTPLGARTLVFTMTNGKAPVYDKRQPYTDALRKTEFDRRVEGGTGDTLQSLGIFDFLKMIFNAVIAAFRSLRAALSF